MTALWLDTDNFGQQLQRESFRGEHSERWLQELLFNHPELIPLNLIEPGSGGMIPICEELRLPGGVRVDILGVTRHGRPVLVECKLWRNPQARREVVAQLFEYAALFARWTYSDLEAQLRTQLLDWEGENPLFAHVRDRLEEPDEARFVDLFTRSLRAGDFHLIIAGDGIREDIHSIAGHITGNGARLALVEFQIWTDDAGRTLVVPNVPVKTEVIRQRLIVAADGVRVELEEADSDEEAVTDPGKAATWAMAKAFWERFINQVHFDHQDQPAPKHGSHNTVKIVLPQPAQWLTAYRTVNGDIGFYLNAKGNEWLFDALSEQASEIREETGLANLRFHHWNKPGERGFGIDSSIKSLGDDDQQLTWLCDTANRLVTALRPRLSALDASRDS